MSNTKTHEQVWERGIERIKYPMHVWRHDQRPFRIRQRNWFRHYSIVRCRGEGYASYCARKGIPR